MKSLFSLTFLFFSTSTFAQDSTLQKHTVFNLKGISIMGSYSSYINPAVNSQTQSSKQSLVNTWQDLGSKPYFTYPQYRAYNIGNGSTFGAYFNFDNYTKKKKRYSIHSHTNLGISLATYQGITADFAKIEAKRIDTVNNFSTGNNIPSFNDSITLYDASIKYSSTNIGLDIQEVFSTNQERRVSVFIGIGASANFSIISKIRESLIKERGINNTLNSIYDYNKNGVNLLNPKIDYWQGNISKIKNSILYQFYIPAGITIRFGSDENKTLSHFYFSPQIRVGYQLIRFSTNSNYGYIVCYTSLGLAYRF